MVEPSKEKGENPELSSQNRDDLNPNQMEVLFLAFPNSFRKKLQLRITPPSAKQPFEEELAFQKKQRRAIIFWGFF